MKSLVCNIIVLIFLLWYCGLLKISLSPFSISFPGWHVALGMVLIAFGIELLALGKYQIGYEAGNDRAMKIFHEVLEKKANKIEAADIEKLQ